MSSAFRLLPCVLLVAGVASAQQPGPLSAKGRSSISGVVTDSISELPLRFATVQLVSSDGAPFTRTTLADSLGVYALTELPEGRYLIGFMHPMLDSLGLEPPVRDVVVRGEPAQRVDLAIPSAATIRDAVCGKPHGDAFSAMVIGFARTARDASAAPGVKIVGEWHELSFTSSGIVRQVPRVELESAENGWFAMCGVPRGGLMSLTASRGNDSSGVVEIQVPEAGFTRRDLYIASAPLVDSAPGVGASPQPGARPLRRGDVQLRGTVRRQATGEPIARARVSIVEGPESVTDEQGQWVMSNAPPGTRMLEVRAVGLYPERVAVNVVPGAPPIDVGMRTFAAVLETINVRAGRLADHRGFASRKRIGAGRYIEPADYANRHIENLTDILRLQPGIRIERDSLAQPQIYYRGVDGIGCSPDVYIDGQHIWILSATDIDDLVRPERVRAIEIYSAATSPPQYMRAHGGCGSIVIWTR